MRVDFQTTDRWRGFYEKYTGTLPKKIGNKSWVNFPCLLSTHPKIDSTEHGGSNLASGGYKCWNAECRLEYNRRLGYTTTTSSPPREVISAVDFLILMEDFERVEAERIVEAYRFQDVDNGATPPDKFHLDDFSRSYSPERLWEDFVKNAQDRLQPELEIVRDYCESRGLRFETLVNAGMGYVPEDPENDQETCLIHRYLQNNIVVGIRGRTADGRKGGIKGAYSTLYQLESLLTTTSRTCILTEGETDCLVMKQLLADFDLSDIPVFGIPGSSYDISWNRHLQRFTRIILVAQTDIASVSLARKVGSSIPDRLEVLQPPFPPQSYGKDVADFLKMDPGNAQILVDHLGLSLDDIRETPYVLSLPDLLDLAQKDIPWLIPEIFERSTKSLIVGEPKTQKTWIAIQLAVAVTTATSFMGIPTWTPTQTGRVLFIEDEGSAIRFGQRLAKVLQLDPLAPLPLAYEGLPLHVIHRQWIKLDADESFGKLRHEALKLKPDLIIFDPYASLHSGDENVVQDTMKVVNAFNNLMRVLPDVAIVIIHHSPKGGSGARGSGALWGAMDTQIGVRRTEIGIQLDIRGRELPDERSTNLEFTFNFDLGRHEPIGMITTVHSSNSHSNGTAPKEENTSSSSTKDDERIWKLFTESPSTWFTRGDIMTQAKAPIFTVIPTLRKLVAEGRVNVQGDTYRFVGET